MGLARDDDCYVEFSMLSTRIAFMAVAATLLSLATATAQTYPTRPIMMIVPFAAGGPSDTIARLVAQKMSSALDQQVNIENVAGAGGAIGTRRVAQASPDGYTILINDLALPAAPLLNRSAGYDALNDLDTIGLVNAGPMVWIARRGIGADDAKGLLALMKATPEKFTLGHSGIGSNSYICGQLVQQALGIKLVEVPFRGAGPAMNDMIAGQIDLMCEQSTTAIPQIQGNRVTGYAVTSSTRMDTLPSLPTMAEAGLTGLEFTVWHGLYAPKGTPPAAIETLNRALQSALADAVARQRFIEAGRTEFPSDRRTPVAHRAALEAEIVKLRTALEKAGVSAAN
jgi:tripartite-type tricarboxylate transporter receptor subunit TctC